MLERPQERPAGVDRVVAATGFEREQKSQVRVLHRDLARLRREAPGLGDGRRVPGATALDEREGSRDQRHDQRRRDDGEQDAQPTCPTLRALEVASLGVQPCLQELALET